MWARLAGHTLLNAFLITILLLITALPPVFPLRAGGSNLKILYVVTDAYDEVYLKDFFRRYGGYKGSIASLASLDGIDLGHYDVVVLTDPNWVNAEKAQEAAERILDYVTGGGRVVATLNGIALLSLSPRWRDIVDARVVDKGVSSPEDYNIAKYKAVYIESPLLVHQGMFLEVLRLGRGYVACIPLNLVWAYVDTRNTRYLDILAEALKSIAGTGFEHRGQRLLTASLAIAVGTTLSLLGSLRDLREARRAHRGVKSPITPLWTRISREEVLRNPKRRLIYEKLLEVKAITFNELLRATGLPKAVLSWHLYVLERHGLVKIRRSHKPRRTVVSIPTDEGIRKAEELLSGKRSKG
jgi:DNA-binding transcriptional ArsR family regulator